MAFQVPTARFGGIRYSALASGGISHWLKLSTERHGPKRNKISRGKIGRNMDVNQMEAKLVTHPSPLPFAPILIKRVEL